MNKIERIKYLVEFLNKANKAYYQEDRELISNFEYDKLYDELVKLEKEENFILSSSPTLKVGYEASKKLEKKEHETHLISLDKTKSVEDLEDFIKDKEGILSLKLDGITIALFYEDGILKEALTRGDGIFGEVVTNNAKVFSNVPLTIPYKNKLLIRGEALIKYSDFYEINEKIELEEEKYKNPRNLASGSVRQLDANITKERRVNFIAFSLISSELGYKNVSEELEFLEKQGFSVVEHKKIDKNNLREGVEFFSLEVKNLDFPCDGLVLTLNDIEYGKSLGRTAKFYKNAISFKWQDELKETRLKSIEWNASRTGLINPIAIFDEVELEGTKVTRASLHNLSMVEKLELGIGDRIRVYKANMIIPQIEENLDKTNNIEIPKFCPVCKEKTTIKKDKEARFLCCENENCRAKAINKFVLASSRDVLNIDGLSKATLEKFVELGFLKELSDIYKLKRYKEEIINLEGFGEKSYYNLIEAIEKSRETSFDKFLSALSISMLGKTNAKLLKEYFEEDIEKIKVAKEEELKKIKGIGEVLAKAIVSYFSDDNKLREFDNLLKELNIVKSKKTEDLKLKDLNFVITGSTNKFENRNKLKEFIEENAGKVLSSISKNVDYLINNDLTSNSSKNKKAKDLGIKIISEDEFLELLK